MKVREILDSKGWGFESITPNRSVQEALDRISQKSIGSLLVMHEDELVGIVTERDILRHLRAPFEQALSAKVERIMTSRVVVGVCDDDLELVKKLFTVNRFRHLPIMEGRRVVGVISIGDLIKAELSDLQVENRYLKDYISGRYPG